MSETQDNPPPPAKPPAAYVAMLAVGIAAAVLAAVVATLLVIHQPSTRRDDPFGLSEGPLESKRLEDLKNQAGRRAEDRQLKKQISELDLQLRRQYFRKLTLARRGNWLLLGCVAVFLIGVRSAMASAKRLRPPEGKVPDVGQEMRAVRWSRAAVVFLTVLLVAAAVGPGALEAYVRWTTPAARPVHFADPNEVRRYWAQFRGPGGQGVSAYTNVPQQWDANTGRNILWKSPVPLPGKGSAVVWGKKVFVSGATLEQRGVFCFAADTGQLLWSGSVDNVAGSPATVVEAQEDTGYAAPTPVVDDRHVFAVFSNGDLACFDHAGKLVWAKGLGAPNNGYGHGSSLAMFRNLVLVLWDQGGVEDYMSRLYAFDGRNGRTIWEVRRPVGSSWATPALIHDGAKHQLITSANPWVISYDPATGKQLWKADCMDGADVASTVAYADGIAYAASTADLFAIGVDGEGDVTDTRVLWTGRDGLPETTSPLTDGKLLWLLEGGDLTCYDAKKGEVVYEEHVKGVFTASPSLVGDKLYLVSTKGVAYIVSASREFKVLGVNPLNERVSASPAFQDGRIYLRGEEHLYCIGASAPATRKTEGPAK